MWLYLRLGTPVSSAFQTNSFPSSSIVHRSPLFRNMRTISRRLCDEWVPMTVCVATSTSKISPVLMPSHNRVPSCASSTAGLKATAVTLTVSPWLMLMTCSPEDMSKTRVTYPAVHRYCPQTSASRESDFVPISHKPALLYGGRLL